MNGTDIDVIVFDVNETLSDLSDLAEEFAALGTSPDMATLWFSNVLRDGFALTAAGVNPSFSDVAVGALTPMLTGLGNLGNVEAAAAAARIMDRFQTLPVHPDVTDGIRALRRQGLRLVTLSNGASSVAEQLLERAGLAADFELLLSVAEALAWKPATSAYHYAAEQCETDPKRMMLVAAHPWDIDGAARAGLRTGWLNRTGKPYPAHFRAPGHAARSLTELAEQLAAPP